MHTTVHPRVSPPTPLLTCSCALVTTPCPCTPSLHLHIHTTSLHPHPCPPSLHPHIHTASPNLHCSPAPSSLHPYLCVPVFILHLCTPSLCSHTHTTSLHPHLCIPIPTLHLCIPKSSLCPCTPIPAPPPLQPCLSPPHHCSPVPDEPCWLWLPMLPGFGGVPGGGWGPAVVLPAAARI